MATPTSRTSWLPAFLDSTPSTYPTTARSPSFPIDLTQLPTILIATPVFIVLWSWLRRYTTGPSGRPIPFFGTLIVLNSQLYALFSLALLVAAVQSLTTAAPPQQLLLHDRVRRTYHYSKFYEWVDVLLLAGQGKAIGPHMAFHHLAMPFFSLFRVLGCAQWEWFVVCNLGHHVLLYAFYGGWMTGLLRPVLHYTQILQLAVGAGVDVWWFVARGKTGGEPGLVDDQEQVGRAIGLLLLLRFAQLYWAEYKAETPARAEVKGAGTATQGEAATKKDRGVGKKTK